MASAFMIDMWSGRASAGDAAAQFQLGACLELGVGTPADLEAACRWFRRAAAQGHPRAQYHLGLAYSYGAPGVAWDLAEACKWLTLANRNGIPEAGAALQQMRMPHQQRSLGEAMAREFMAQTEPAQNLPAAPPPSEAEQSPAAAVQLAFDL